MNASTSASRSERAPRTGENQSQPEPVQRSIILVPPATPNNFLQPMDFDTEAAVAELMAAARPLACVPCRSMKKRCDFRKPRCGRCAARNIECTSVKPAPRRRRIEQLERKTMALEAKCLSLSREQDRAISSQSLFQRIHQLDVQTQTQGRVPSWIKSVVALFPDPFDRRLQSQIPEASRHEVYGGDSLVGYEPVIQRDGLDAIARLWTPDQPVSQQFSFYLIRLFLPYRSHCHFYMDLPYFFDALLRPPEDPKSLHPALLNAIFQAACMFADGPLQHLQAYFLRKTQQHLDECLAQADRLTHFLWAQIILGACFTCRGRSKEAYMAIASCSRLALACGLGVSTGVSAVTAASPLLPPAIDEFEEVDRFNLSQSVYMVDRAMAMITGYPSVFVTSTSTLKVVEANEPTSRVNPDLIAPPLESPDETAHAVVAQTTSTELHNPLFNVSGALNGAWPMRVRAMLLYERVERLAFDTGGKLDSESRVTFAALEDAISSFKVELPPLPSATSSGGDSASSPSGNRNPYVFGAHIIYQGTVQLLYSLADDVDITARRRVFDAARSLGQLAAQLRGDGVKDVQAFLSPVVHMLNAARVLTAELKRLSVKKSSQKAAVCYQSLTMLFDFLRDIAIQYPAWFHIMGTIRSLIADADSSILSANAPTLPSPT